MREYGERRCLLQPTRQFAGSLSADQKHVICVILTYISLIIYIMKALTNVIYYVVVAGAGSLDIMIFSPETNR